MDNESTVHTRKLDDLGRITIPEHIRQLLDWRHGDRMVIEITDQENRGISIRPARPVCSLCHSETSEWNGLIPLRNGNICKSCREELLEKLASDLD